MIYFTKYYGASFVERSSIYALIEVPFIFMNFFILKIRVNFALKTNFILIITVCSYCSLKNNVLLFIFRLFRTNNRIRSSMFEASG